MLSEKNFFKNNCKSGTRSSGRKRQIIECYKGPVVSAKEARLQGPFFVQKNRNCQFREGKKNKSYNPRVKGFQPYIDI